MTLQEKYNQRLKNRRRKYNWSNHMSNMDHKILTDIKKNKKKKR